MYVHISEDATRRRVARRTLVLKARQIARLERDSGAPAAAIPPGVSLVHTALVHHRLLNSRTAEDHTIRAHYGPPWGITLHFSRPSPKTSPTIRIVERDLNLNFSAGFTSQSRASSAMYENMSAM